MNGYIVLNGENKFLGFYDDLSVVLRVVELNELFSYYEITNEVKNELLENQGRIKDMVLNVSLIPDEQAEPEPEPELEVESLLKPIVIDSMDYFIFNEPVIDIKSLKASVIQKFSYNCNQAIEQGVNINGEHFSYNTDDQINIKNLFDLAMAIGSDGYVPYHSNDEMCKMYSTEEVKTIYLTAQMNLIQQTTYFNMLKAYINSLEDVDVIKNIQYGDELVGEYLERYNAIMEKSTIILNTLQINI